MTAPRSRTGLMKHIIKVILFNTHPSQQAIALGLYVQRSLIGSRYRVSLSLAAVRILFF